MTRVDLLFLSVVASTAAVGHYAVAIAVNGFAESLMLEVRDAGVKVSVVMPGSVATDMLVGDNPDRSWMLQPEDVADCVMLAVNLPERAVIEELLIRPR